jgi:uncharacterized protein involved in exopolysaccharide biosynthesis
MGGLSGLAGLAGIRLPAGASDQTITADLYPEVAKSLDFRISVAETPIEFSDLKQTATSVTYFRDLREIPLLENITKYSIGLPALLLTQLRSSSPRAESGQVGNQSGSQTLLYYDHDYLKLVNHLEKRLSVSIDKKTSVITIAGEMPDPFAAADLVRVASDRLMERIIEYESRKAGEQFRFVNDQYQQSRKRYEQTQRALATFTDRNRALMSATSQIERDRLQREYDLAYEVFQQFSRELEQARIKMNQDTPVFTVLEQVIVPTKRSSPKRAKILFLASLVGVVLGVGRVAQRAPV